jgi:hypothetical protein
MRHLQTFESYSYGGSYDMTNEEYVIGWVKNWVKGKIENQFKKFLENIKDQLSD